MRTIASVVFEALHFSEPRFDALNRLTDAEWRQLLAFCNRAQLVIPFALRYKDRVPAWLADHFEHNLQDNAERWRRTRLEYGRVSAAFQTAGLEFVVLKGFSHAPALVADPWLRPQGDLDLLLLEDQVRAARDVALGLDYESVDQDDSHPIDHLPTLIRKTGWEWHGNEFDPELPLDLELHFRLWDAGTEGFALPGVEDFWQRRQRRWVDGVEFTSLGPTDLPAYASAHALRHLLRGDLRPSHIYEIAWFLEHNSGEQFWSACQEMHDEPLRRVQAICFAIARNWFGCRVPAVPAAEIERLPEPVLAWLATYGRKYVQRSAKDELWLHLSLLDPGSSRLAVVRRRLLPLQLPGPVSAVHLPADASTGAFGFAPPGDILFT